MAKGGPGKAHRKGITLAQLVRMFPDDDAAAEWFEGVFWGGERCCPKCGGLRTKPTKSGKPMPYWCPDCRKYFSVRTGTVLRALAHIAPGLGLRDLSRSDEPQGRVQHQARTATWGSARKSAWFMLHRIRETLADHPEARKLRRSRSRFDETYIGGKRKEHEQPAPQAPLKGTGRGTVGKAAVVGAKDQGGANRVKARVIKHTDSADASSFRPGQHARGRREALHRRREPRMEEAVENHETVKHSAQEYVRYLAGEKIPTNGVESFWSMLKRAHTGTFHRLSVKHLQRYVDEFVARHNVRQLNTLDQMAHVAAGMVGRRLMYRDLVADNGRSARAR